MQRTSKRLGLALTALALVASACGETRRDPNAVVTEPPPVVTDEGTDSTALTEDPAPPAPATLPEPLGLDPAGVAATITFEDGTVVEVPNSEVITAEEGFRASETFVNLVLESGGVPIPIENVMIDQLILRKVIDERLADAGAEIAPGNLEQARIELGETLEQSVGGTDGVRLLDEMAGYGELVSGIQAGIYALADTVPAADLPCVSHILLETEAEAQQAIDDIAAGAVFAEVAMERSTGPSGPQGGELGCASADGYVPEFRDAVNTAEIGEVVGPVQTQFGFHVLIVTAVEVDSSAAASVGAARGIAQERLAGATVEVNPKLGTWDPASQTVIPA